MKESDILAQVVGLLNTELPSFCTVRTSGGEDPNTTPLVTIKWRTARQSDNGANPHAAYEITDTSAKEVNHYYYRMYLTLLVQDEDEELAFDLGDTVGRAFMPYERRPNDFDPRTYEWEVGEVQPAFNPAVEPDWYEAKCDVSFGFLKETTRDIETLDDIQQNINSN